MAALHQQSGSSSWYSAPFRSLAADACIAMQRLHDLPMLQHAATKLGIGIQTAFSLTHGPTDMHPPYLAAWLDNIIASLLYAPPIATPMACNISQAVQTPCIHFIVSQCCFVRSHMELHVWHEGGCKDLCYVCKLCSLLSGLPNFAVVALKVQCRLLCTHQPSM